MAISVIADNIARGKQLAYLASASTSVDLVYIEPGLTLTLAPNSRYAITARMMFTSSGDGQRVYLNYTGSTLFFGGVKTLVSGAVSATSLNTKIQTATADEIIGIDGVVETATGGVLYVTYSKLTDVGGDTSMNAGSFLRVSPVP